MSIDSQSLLPLLPIKLPNLRLICWVNVHCNSGTNVLSAYRADDVSDKTYYGWRWKYWDMNRPHLAGMTNLDKENQGLKKIIADLELDKLNLQERRDYIIPKA